MNPHEIKELIERALKKDKLASSYILYGGKESEREDIGYFLAMKLQCSEPNKPCGECYYCKQVRKDLHPDVKWIKPDNSLLSIDQVRLVKNEIYIKPYSGQRKLYLFKIEYIKDEAANAFLKVLEEPPPYGVLVILSSNINYFLPTIISRCQRLRLDFCLPELTEEMSKSYDEFQKIALCLKKLNFWDFFQEIKALTEQYEKESVENWLSQVIWVYRDIFLSNNRFPKELLVNQNLYGTREKGNLSEKIEKILDLKGKIKYNINIKLGLENLFLQLAEVAKWQTR